MNVRFAAIYPEAFGGRDALTREMQWIADACHANPPVDPKSPVRLPGEGAMRTRREQLRGGFGCIRTS